MDASSPAHPRVLLVDDDQDIREALGLLLADVGYDTSVASSLARAIEQVETTTFQLIVTDSFAHRPSDALASIQSLQRRAYPTPVGILSGWTPTRDEVQQAGFAFFVAKPFDLDELLAQIAATIQTPLNSRQSRQVPVVHRYFAALTARDWDALVELCTEDVIYILPGTTPFSTTIIGKAALRAYSDETFGHFPAASFHDVAVYASPTGLAARYRGRWAMPDGSEAQMTGAVHFQFEGERIQQIGVRLNDERLRALVQAQQNRQTPGTSPSQGA